MAFEAFLNDPHARPARTSGLGYLASLALHGPPMVWFAVTWLTHAMLIGSSGFVTEHRVKPAILTIPVSFFSDKHGAGSAASEPSKGRDTGKPRAGIAGRSGRGTRRGLVSPHEVKPLPSNRPEIDMYAANVLLAALQTDDGLGSSSGTGSGLGGDGFGDGTIGIGHGGGGLGIGGFGDGTSGGLPTAVHQQPVHEAAGHEPLAGVSSGRGGRPNDGAPAPGSEVEVEVAPGRAIKAAYISQESAAYYRNPDASFPSLPEAYWATGRSEYRMLFQICVSTEGTVSKVVTLKSATREIDDYLSAAIRSWRYRPRIVAGMPSPFCHPILLTYSRQLRLFH